jgi:hypothetical protein
MLESIKCVKPFIRSWLVFAMPHFAHADPGSRLPKLNFRGGAFN